MYYKVVVIVYFESNNFSQILLIIIYLVVCYYCDIGYLGYVFRMAHKMITEGNVNYDRSTHKRVIRQMFTLAVHLLIVLCYSSRA